MKQDLHIGVVASLHSLGLLDACCREEEHFTGWQTTACPGYSSLVRQMRAKRVQAALLPFDWFGSHFLRNEEEASQWQVIQAWSQCAMDFWLCKHLKKRLARLRRAGPCSERGADHEIRVAIDTASILMQDWAAQRLSQMSGQEDLIIKWQHLPVSLMPSSIKSGLVDAMIMPAPWSHAEELSAEGSVDKAMAPGTHDLGFVLVVDQESDAMEPIKSRQLLEACPGGNATRPVDPKRLTCNQHAALPPLRDPGTINRQFTSLPPPVAPALLADWLSMRIPLLKAPTEWEKTTSNTLS